MSPFVAPLPLSPSSASSLSEGDAEGTLKKALDSVLTADARSSTSVGRRGRQTAAAVEITPDARWVGQEEGLRGEGGENSFDTLTESERNFTIQYLNINAKDFNTMWLSSSVTTILLTYWLVTYRYIYSDSVNGEVVEQSRSKGCIAVRRFDLEGQFNTVA